MESAILERYTRNSLFKIKNSLDYDLKDSTKSVKALLQPSHYFLVFRKLCHTSSLKIGHKST
jgi:hypothetical protein